MLSFKFFTFWGVAMLAGLLLGPMLSAWKNRDTSFWGAVGFLFPPGLVVLLALPRYKGPPRRDESWDERDRRESERHNPDN